MRLNPMLGSEPDMPDWAPLEVVGDLLLTSEKPLHELRVPSGLRAPIRELHMRIILKKTPFYCNQVRRSI